MTPTWGELWLRICGVVGWRLRALRRGLALAQLRHHRRRRAARIAFYSSRRGAAARRAKAAEAVADWPKWTPGQVIKVYGKERPMFTAEPGQIFYPASMFADVAQQVYRHCDGTVAATRESLHRMRAEELAAARAKAEFIRNHGEWQ